MTSHSVRYRLPSRPGWCNDEPTDHADIDAVLDYLSTQPLAPVDEVTRSTGIERSRIAELAGLASDRIGVIGGEPSVVFRVVSSVSPEDDNQSIERRDTR